MASCGSTPWLLQTTLEDRTARRMGQPLRVVKRYPIYFITYRTNYYLYARVVYQVLYLIVCQQATLEDCAECSRMQTSLRTVILLV